MCGILKFCRGTKNSVALKYVVLFLNEKALLWDMC